MKSENGGFSILTSAEGRPVELTMEGLWLTGQVLPVGAHLTVVHTFRSGEREPVEAVYAFGLPRDAALRRFKIMGEGFEVRSELRRNHNFSRNPKRKFGVECVFSTEQPLYPKEDGTVCHRKPGVHGLTLDCAMGYGASSCVTATFAFVAAARILRRVVG